ncbi:alkaline phosphatase family protein [Sunxiuqinia elliptica]
MRTKTILLLLVGIAILISCTKQPRAKRVVMIALDGISVEGYQTAQHPNIDRLVKEGVLSLSTRVVMPSITQPNWTSHLTGAGPEQHGVIGNDWTLDNIKLPPAEKDDDGYFPSIFTILKEQVPDVKTAFYYNWGPLINPYNQKYFDESSFLENDAYAENYTMALNFIIENEDLPTCVFLYSGHTDNTGHRHGWKSAKYISAIEEADVQIGKLIDELQKVGLFDDTYFLVLSDHGGKGKGHGGVSLDEMEVPWLICGPSIKSSQAIKSPNTIENTAAVIAKVFDCDLPSSWTGKVPDFIFEN